MQIVINNTYGGFGVSEKAVRRLRELGMPAEQTGPLSGEMYNDGSGPCTNDNSFGHDVPRNSPLLVQVVLELGEESNTPYSKLKVVTIPDDVEWQIEEYDGTEWVSEKHRTWG